MTSLATHTLSIIVSGLRYLFSKNTFGSCFPSECIPAGGIHPKGGAQSCLRHCTVVQGHMVGTEPSPRCLAVSQLIVAGCLFPILLIPKNILFSSFGRYTIIPILLSLSTRSLRGKKKRHFIGAYYRPDAYLLFLSHMSPSEPCILSPSTEPGSLEGHSICKVMNPVLR